MLEKNKTVVKRMFDEAWNQGKLEVVDELLNPSSVDHNEPIGTDFPAHLKHNILCFRRAFPDLRFTIKELIGEGDLVSARVLMTGTHQNEFMGVPATGKSFSMQQMHMVRIANGQGVEHWAVLDMSAMLHQLGLQTQN